MVHLLNAAAARQLLTTLLLRKGFPGDCTKRSPHAKHHRIATTRVTKGCAAQTRAVRRSFKRAPLHWNGRCDQSVVVHLLNAAASAIESATASCSRRAGQCCRTRRELLTTLFFFKEAFAGDWTTRSPHAKHHRIATTRVTKGCAAQTRAGHRSFKHAP